jgi:hypothetical protein
MLDGPVPLSRVWEEAERVGADLVDRRDGEIRAMLEGRPPEPPANAPDLLVVSPDGGRIQDRSRPEGDRWCEYKAAVVYRVSRDDAAREGVRPDPQLAPHWRYRAGTDGFERVEAGEKTYRDPEPETKTYTASTETVERFPLMVELEAKRRGLMEANTVAVVGDGGDFVWRTAKEAAADRRAGGKRIFEVLDIIHAGEHLADAAKAAFGATTEGASWLNARHAELWRGDADELIRALEAKAGELAPRPGPEKSPARVLWNARDYFYEHRERIRYDTFRRHGLPLTSCHIESGIKQTNHRVKGSEKQWLLPNAEAMLALRCLGLSEDGRWKDHFDAVKDGRIVIPRRRKDAMSEAPVRAARTSTAPQTTTDGEKAA